MLSAPLSRGITGPLTSPLTGRGRAAFNPAQLFATGEQGAWYDPSDLGTMFQDHTGAIPATAGSPIGLMLDKSGRGNHLTQPTAAARPTLRQDGNRWYLQSDGADDRLSLNFASGWFSNPVEVHWAGSTPGSGGAGAAGLGLQFSATGRRCGTLVGSSGNFHVSTPINEAALRYDFYSNAGSFLSKAVRGASVNSASLTAYFNGSAVRSQPIPVGQTVGDGGNTGGIIFGAGYPTEFYGGVLLFADLQDAHRNQLHGWLANKAGITL